MAMQIHVRSREYPIAIRVGAHHDRAMCGLAQFPLASVADPAPMWLWFLGGGHPV
jgi:hypothetical protein